jgi:hypothetical protein
VVDVSPKVIDGYAKYADSKLYPMVVAFLHTRKDPGSYASRIVGDVTIFASAPTCHSMGHLDVLQLWIPRLEKNVFRN